MVNIIHDRLFTPEQAAAHFGVSRPTIYAWLRRGLESVRMGGRRYTTAEALQRFARQDTKSSVAISVAQQPDAESILQMLRDRGLKD